MYMITLEESKSIKGAEKLTDSILTALIEEKESIIEEHCKTSFKPLQWTQKNDPTLRVILRKKPVIKIDTMTVKGVPLKEDTDFYSYPEKSLVEIPDLFKNFRDIPRRAIVTEYTYGFEKVPATVKKVLKDLVKLELEEENTSLSMSSEDFDSEYSYQKRDKTPAVLEAEILSRLGPYIQSEDIEESDGNVRALLV